MAGAFDINGVDYDLYVHNFRCVPMSIGSPGSRTVNGTLRSFSVAPKARLEFDLRGMQLSGAWASVLSAWDACRSSSISVTASGATYACRFENCETAPAPEVMLDYVQATAIASCMLVLVEA